MSLPVSANRRRLLNVGVVGALSAPVIVSAQTRWKPERPIVIYNPFAAGGVTDLHLRFMAEKVSKIIGKYTTPLQQSFGIGPRNALTDIALVGDRFGLMQRQLGKDRLKTGSLSVDPLRADRSSAHDEDPVFFSPAYGLPNPRLSANEPKGSLGGVRCAINTDSIASTIAW